MERSSHISFESWSTRFSLAAGLVVALCIAGTARPAGAQTNTSLGGNALGSITTGTNNTALGLDALFRDTTGSFNTATGVNALLSNTTGIYNTATGKNALLNNTTGGNNTATGKNALDANTTGNNNTAVGKNALTGNTGGNGNIAVGFGAGDNLTTGSNNIDIGNEGLAGESNVIRIGTNGTQTRTVIAGVSDSHVFVGSPVLVNANGRLGVAVSSARYKRDIRDMGEASERLMKLRPVTFRYKEDPAGTVQYGLVAEEVARVYPELVTYGDDGKPLSVAYHLLPAMLLNEMQKQVRENRRKDAEIAALKEQVESLQKEKTQIDWLTARLSALEQHARSTRPERMTAAMR